MELEQMNFKWKNFLQTKGKTTDSEHLNRPRRYFGRPIYQRWKRQSEIIKVFGENLKKKFSFSMRYKTFKKYHENDCDQN